MLLPSLTKLHQLARFRSIYLLALSIYYDPMKAIQVSQVGGPEALRLVDLPIPEPKPNEAVVEIKAAGVNFVDVYYREGRYPAKPPFIVGVEAAGVVIAVGSEAKGVQPGDRVAYTGVLGSYAEYAAVPAERLVHIAIELDFIRLRGYVVLFGGSSGAVPPFDLIKLSQKGSLYITRPTLAHYTASREELEQRSGEVMQMIVKGDLHLRIHKIYKLADAQQAHRDLEGRKTT